MKAKSVFLLRFFLFSGVFFFFLQRSVLERGHRESVFRCAFGVEKRKEEREKRESEREIKKKSKESEAKNLEEGN